MTDNNGNTSEFSGYGPGAVIGCSAPEPPPFEAPVFYGLVATMRDSDIALTGVSATETAILVGGSPVAKDSTRAPVELSIRPTRRAISRYTRS